MKAENVYVGDIFICTTYPDRYSRKLEEAKIEKIKEDVILIKNGEQYFDLEDINSDLDLLKTKKNGLKTYYTYEGDKFVGNLKRYTFNKNEKISVKTLKRNRKK